MKPKLSDLTLREKIGQTLCFRRALLNDIDDLQDFFRKNPAGSMFVHPGSNIRFDNVGEVNNVGDASLDPQEKIFTILKQINSVMKIPMIPAMDVERGINVFSGHPAIPSASSIGATRSEALAEALFAALAEDIKTTGISWVWSPVVDLTSPFSGGSLTRALSSDLEVVKTLAAAEIRGLQNHGVPATVKHFPGSDGREYRDSHFASRCNNLSYEEWVRTQGSLFQAGIDAGVASVMIGHGAFPAVDDQMIAGNYIPSTLSYKIVTELLKEKMGFKGVVITDAVGMKALTACYPQEKLYVELLRAGNDMILGPMTLDYVDVVEEAVLSGDLPESRIDDACQRILDMKERYGLFQENYTIKHYTDEERKPIFEDLKKYNRQIAEKSLTLVANRENILPLNRNAIKKVKLIYFGYLEEVYNRLDTVIETFAKYGAVADKQKLVGQDIKQIAEDYDLIVYVPHIGPHSPFGMPAFYQEECKALMFAMTEGREKSVGVSFASPYTFFDYFSSVPVFVNAYSYNVESMEAFVQGLYGDVPFEGISPFPLNPLEALLQK